MAMSHSHDLQNALSMHFSQQEIKALQIYQKVKTGARLPFSNAEAVKCILAHTKLLRNAIEKMNDETDCIDVPTALKDALSRNFSIADIKALQIYKLTKAGAMVTSEKSDAIKVILSNISFLREAVLKVESKKDSPALHHPMEEMIKGGKALQDHIDMLDSQTKQLRQQVDTKNYQKAMEITEQTEREIRLIKTELSAKMQPSLNPKEVTRRKKGNLEQKRPMGEMVLIEKEKENPQPDMQVQYRELQRELEKLKNEVKEMKASKGISQDPTRRGKKADITEGEKADAANKGGKTYIGLMS